MTMRQRRHKHGRQKHMFKLSSPDFFVIGYMTTTQALRLMRNPWQIFKRR